MESERTTEPAAPVRTVEAAPPSLNPLRRPIEPIGQAKMSVGSADDPLEHQADHLADMVVRSMRDGGHRLQRSTTPTVRRMPTIRRVAPMGRDGGTLDAETEQSLKLARHGGHALDADAQRRMGDTLGADVSGVRLHDGPQARDLNERMGAEAFTVGNDVFFRDSVPDTSSEDGMRLVAHEVAHTVQQGASPVARKVVDADEAKESEGGETETEEAGETETEEAKSDETETEDGETETEDEEKQEETEEEAAVEASGTLPDVKESVGPEDIEGRKKGEEDARVRRSAGPARPRPTQATARRSDVIELDANVGTSTAVREGRDAFGDADAAVKAGEVKTTGNVTGPTAEDPFGAMATTIEINGIAWKLVKGKVIVDMTIAGTFEWGTNGGGNIDVPSPTSGLVTAENYEEMSTDLTPVLEGKCWRPPRDKYWSAALTERHEKYHANDANGYVKKKGPGVVKSYLKKHPLKLSEAEQKDNAKIGSKLDEVIEGARQAVADGRFYYFRKGLSDYLSYPGEIRAFGDGKAPYMKLAKGVKAHGKKLAAAKKKEAEKKKGADDAKVDS